MNALLLPPSPSGDLSPLLPPESRNNYRCLRYQRERRDSIRTRRIVPCSPTWGGYLAFSPQRKRVYTGGQITPPYVRYPLTKSPPPRKEGGILLLLSSLIHSPVCICGTDRSRFPTKTGRGRGGGKHNGRPRGEREEEESNGTHFLHRLPGI